MDDLLDPFEPIGSAKGINPDVGEGDIVTSVNGRGVASTRELIAAYRRGESNVFRVWSPGARRYYSLDDSLPVTARPASGTAPTP
jgi:S1-C subfamily serine protease